MPLNAETDLYMRALRTRWWLIAVVVLAAVAAARFLTARDTPVYRATASSTVAPTPDLTETPELLRALETLERRTILATFAQLPASRGVKQRAADAAGLRPAELGQYGVSASVVPNTNILRIQVEGPDAIRASELANAVAQVTADEAGRLYRLFAIAPLDPAIPPRGAVRPDPMRNAIVAGILGLFLGLVVTVGLEALAPFTTRPDPSAPEPHARAGLA